MIDVCADKHCAELLRDGLGVTFGGMLFEAVCHLVSEDGGNLIFIEVETAN